MKICFPARKSDGTEYSDLKEIMDRIGREPHGSWLAGTNCLWHGGIHISDVSAPASILKEDNADTAIPLQCMADGEVVAWRVNQDYLTNTYNEQTLQYSSTFVLIKSICKPDPQQESTWLEFYALYMGLVPLSVYPKSKTIKALKTVLKHPAGSYDASTSATDVADISPGKGYFNTDNRAIVLKEAQFRNHGEIQPFGLVKSLNDKGEATGEAFWVTLLPEYMTQFGEQYTALPAWMQHAIAQGEFGCVVKPSVSVNILAGDAIGFLAKDIDPVGMGRINTSHFAHVEVLSTDSRMPDFLNNPGKVATGKKYIRLGLHKPLYIKTGETFEKMSAITERDGGKVLERDKCNPQTYNGKTWYQIRPHSWMSQDDVDELHQFDLTEREFCALVEESDCEMKKSLRGGWMKDAYSWLSKRINPDKGMQQATVSHFYKAMLDRLDTDQDGMMSNKEIFNAIHYPEMGVRRIASRMVVKHSSEWFGGSSHHKWATYFQNFDILRLGYAKKWLDDCEWMSKVPPFDKGEPIWHMHPIVFLNAIKIQSRKSAIRPKNVQDFLDMASNSAELAAAKWGVPASVLLAQSALESGWGKHVKNNAYFGIKGKSPTGNSTSFGTTEVIDGKVIHIKDTFRAYADYAESADDYGRFLSENKRYKPAFNYTTEPNQFITEIAKAGYATDPNYAPKLIHLMERYDLYEFDK